MCPTTVASVFHATADCWSLTPQASLQVKGFKSTLFLRNKGNLVPLACEVVPQKDQTVFILSKLFLVFLWTYLFINI